jgi:hypothetical protein
MLRITILRYGENYYVLEFAHDDIRMEITILYLKISRINCGFNGRKYLFTGSASASPVNSICDHQIPN